MKEEKYVAVHDSIKESYDKIYGIFNKCAGYSSFAEKVLICFIIILPIIYLIVDYYKWKFSFLFLFLFLLLLSIYYKFVDSRVSGYFVKKLGIKPAKTNAFIIFCDRCLCENISLSEVEEVYEYVDINISLKNLNNFYYPILLTIVMSLVSNRVDELIPLIKCNESTDSYAFILPLLICFYLIVSFLSTGKFRNLLLFKKGLFYVKTKLKKYSEKISEV